jgi:hypothetical protein
LVADMTGLPTFGDVKYARTHGDPCAHPAEYMHVSFARTSPNARVASSSGSAFPHFFLPASVYTLGFLLWTPLSLQLVALNELDSNSEPYTLKDPPNISSLWMDQGAACCEHDQMAESLKRSTEISRELVPWEEVRLRMLMLM